ncbi:MAG: hypothetical protein R2873_27480 [Caldilineaceae bacterium]
MPRITYTADYDYPAPSELVRRRHRARGENSTRQIACKTEGRKGTVGFALIVKLQHVWLVARSHLLLAVTSSAAPEKKRKDLDQSRILSLNATPNIWIATVMVMIRC